MLVRGHQPCDDCGSTDALADYETHTHCFSCGKHRTKTGVRLELSKKQVVVPEGYPEEATDSFSYAAINHLKSFHMNPSQALTLGFRFCWTGEYAKRLIIPVVHNRVVKTFEAKKVDASTYGPKYKMPYGATKESCLLTSGYTTLTIVEDLISALRIKQHSDVLCLRGTRVPNSLFTYTKKYGTIYVWLDYDLAGHKARERVHEILQWHSGTVVDIETDLDPKCYTDTEIEGVLS